jgi:hypothetical protein
MAEKMKFDLNGLMQLIGAHTEFAKDLSIVASNIEEAAGLVGPSLENVVSVLEKATAVLRDAEFELVEQEFNPDLEDNDELMRMLNKKRSSPPTEEDEYERGQWVAEDEDEPS